MPVTTDGVCVPRFVTHLMTLISAELAEVGDRDWLLDSVEDKRIRLSEVEARARRVASGLARLGLGPGDILHTAYRSDRHQYISDLQLEIPSQLQP